MNSEFVGKNKFKKKKLDRPIYIRNMNNTFNHEGLIKHIVEIKMFYRGYKERTEINIIDEQKWSIILEMPWPTYHNLEINWKNREVKITRCPDDCGKK